MSLISALSLFENLDGREDHLVGEYTITSTAISSILAPETSPTVILGIKGIGKSTAIKLIKHKISTSDRSFVIIFDTNTEYFENVPSYTYSSFRNRFRQILLTIIIAHFREYVERLSRGARAPFQNLIERINAALASDFETIKKYLPKLEKVSFVGATIFFDNNLSNSENSNVSFDVINEIVIDILKAGFAFRVLVDDIDQIFSKEVSTDSAMSGLVLACNEININYRPAIVANCFLKAHVFHSLRGEDISNISPNMIQRLYWKSDELRRIVLERLKYKDIKYGDIFDFDEKEFEKLLPEIRNGPRDLVAWIGLALKNLIDSGGHKLTFQDFDTTYADLQEHSRGQVDFAYEDTIPNASSIIMHIFGKEQYAVAELVDRIRDLRVNDNTFVSYDEKANMADEFAYLGFLRQSGSVYIAAQGGMVAPYERDYMKQRSLPRLAIVAIHHVYIRDFLPFSPSPPKKPVKKGPKVRSI